MSTYVRAAANLIIDKPQADGMLTQEGVGRDWPATEPREENYAFTPDVGATAKPAALARLADGGVLMIFVAHQADGGHALQ